MTKSVALRAAASAAFAITFIASAHAQTTPTASDRAMQNPAVKSPSKMTKAPLAKGKTSFTMDEAKARLEKAGYTEVSNLAKDQDGLWQARAMHNGKWVNAAVDYKGNVAAK